MEWVWGGRPRKAQTFDVGTAPPQGDLVLQMLGVRGTIDSKTLAHRQDLGVGGTYKGKLTLDPIQPQGKGGRSESRSSGTPESRSRPQISPLPPESEGRSGEEEVKVQ